MRPLLASVLAGLLAVVALARPAAAAEDRATIKESELLVRKAVEYLKKHGKEKAFAAFSDPRGPFTYRDLYVTVYDLNGMCLAHGQKKERIGKNLSGDKDPSGKLFVAERVQLAKEKGGGWQQYKFLNPATKQVEEKVAYFEKVDDVIISSGAYRR